MNREAQMKIMEAHPNGRVRLGPCPVPRNRHEAVILKAPSFRIPPCTRAEWPDSLSTIKCII